jgi:hypothetical protein
VDAAVLAMTSTALITSSSDRERDCDRNRTALGAREERGKFQYGCADDRTTDPTMSAAIEGQDTAE